MRLNEETPASGQLNGGTQSKGQDQKQCSSVSLISATNPARLSKQFKLQDGELVKRPGGSLVRGDYQRLTLEGPQALAELLPTLRPDQALCFGVAAPESGPIASRKEAQDGELTRTRDHFDWPAGSGWLLIDYDPAERGEPMDMAEFDHTLCEAVPELEPAPTVMGSSGSAYIYDSETGEQLKGAGGLRRYIQVADARDIPRAGDVLFQRLWLAGHGYFAVSKSGALLERGLIDASVWQPERLDFAGGADCVGKLEQRRPEPMVLNPDAEPLDTATALPDLNPEERQQLKIIKAKAREAVADEQQQARQDWIEERVVQWQNDHAADLETVSVDELDELLEQTRERYHFAVMQQRLFGDFKLVHHSGQTVTVGELMDAPESWHGERFADPLEPDYANDKRICWANLRSGGKPYLYSHAHGGQRFTLVRASSTIKTAAGEMPRLVREADDLLRHAGEVFQRGGELVRILDDGKLYPVTGPWLRTHLETIAHWLRFDKRANEWQATDAPGDLHGRILHNRGGWSVPELTGVVRGPILRPDGSLLDKPGHDPETGLLLMADHPDGWPHIPMNPSHDQVREAVKALWEPFEHYPFIDDLSRSVQLSALLTAVQRPMLETAPGFAYNAYKAGSGKTKLAKATAWLGGVVPVESPWTTDAEEQRKRLMASLMEGPSSILLDNISGPMESDTLCAILTSSQFKDRRLGVSEEVSAPTRVLFTATGNNLRLVGDLSRRIFVTTVDHGVESPERLAFPFDPVARVAERWLYYRAAALTVLRGFLADGAPHGGEGQVGGYEQWDALIRQAVVWIKDNGLAPFGLTDPADAVAANYEADPETRKLRALLEGWQSQFGDKSIRVGDLVSSVEPVAFQDCEPESQAELREAMQEIAGEPEKINRRRLGRWIERHAGRVLDGLKIDAAGEYRRARQWRVVKI